MPYRIFDNFADVCWNRERTQWQFVVWANEDGDRPYESQWFDASVTPTLELFKQFVVDWCAFGVHV
jgi:hypothetical protein